MTQAEMVAILAREEHIAKCEDVLRAGGVRERDIEWMAMSCPSLDAAHQEVARQQGHRDWRGWRAPPARLQLQKDDLRTPEGIARAKLDGDAKRAAWKARR